MPSPSNAPQDIGPQMLEWGVVAGRRVVMRRESHRPVLVKVGRTPPVTDMLQHACKEKVQDFHVSSRCAMVHPCESPVVFVSLVISQFGKLWANRRLTNASLAVWLRGENRLRKVDTEMPRALLRAYTTQY